MNFFRQQGPPKSQRLLIEAIPLVVGAPSYGALEDTGRMRCGPYGERRDTGKTFLAVTQPRLVLGNGLQIQESRTIAIRGRQEVPGGGPGHLAS